MSTDSLGPGNVTPGEREYPWTINPKIDKMIVVIPMEANSFPLEWTPYQNGGKINFERGASHVSLDRDNCKNKSTD